jgi:hypothetical protein
VVAGAELDDCVELEPQAATHAATAAAAVMNRMDINLCVLVFKILLPHSGWRLRADGRPDEGSPMVGIFGIGSPIRGLPHVESEAIPAENR